MDGAASSPPSGSAAGIDGRRAVLLGLAATAAVLWPLATYTISLATFGAVHVLAELRYVDRRFASRVSPRLGSLLLVPLLGIAALRVAVNMHWLESARARPLELALGAALVLAVLPVLRRAGLWTTAFGVGMAGALGWAIIVAPIPALLLIAVLHNVTPLAFVADATTGRSRQRALAQACAVFVAIPLLLASGVPWTIAHSLDWAAPEAALVYPGPLVDHMRAYLPVAWHPRAWSLHLFSACAFMQCAHYLYVIDVLPRTLADGARGRAPWPRRFALLGALVAVSTAVGFAWGEFGRARAWYGVLAALHAWVELPLLLLAVAVRPTTH